MNIFTNSNKTIILILSSISLLSIGSCTELNVTEPDKIYGEVFVLDTLDVAIMYEETPGFKYPLMKYDIRTVTHLIKKGNIDTYDFKCEPGNISTSSNIEYGTIEHEPGFKFRNRMTFWSQLLLKPNSIIPYTLHYAGSSEGKQIEYTHISSASVYYFNKGTEPEANALQLTGPENRNYSPLFSLNGNWIYIHSIYDKRSIFKINANGSGYELIEDFSNSQLNDGNFNILDENHIAYVLWKPYQNSKIVIKDLQTMDNTVYEVQGYLWGSEPIRIPNTNKFLNILDPNSSSDYRRRLLAADIQTQKVDTLLKYIQGDILTYTLNPINNKFYLIIRSGNLKDVYEYNFATNELSIFINNIDFNYFKFFPNGTDYAYIRKDKNGYYNIFLKNNGIERQLTTYPGNVYDFNFSPNGQFVVFSAERRGEIQSWIIKI